jgi:hypothetical protein
MNYAIAFLVAILVAAMVYWFLRGRNFYTGPVVEAQFMHDEEAESIQKSSRSDEGDGEKHYLPIV